MCSVTGLPGDRGSPAEIFTDTGLCSAPGETDSQLGKSAQRPAGASSETRRELMNGTASTEGTLTGGHPARARAVPAGRQRGEPGASTPRRRSAQGASRRSPGAGGAVGQP